MEHAPLLSLAHELGLVDDEGNLVIVDRPEPRPENPSRFSLAASLGLSIDEPAVITREVVWPPSASKVTRQCLPFIDFESNLMENSSTPQPVVPPSSSSPQPPSPAPSQPTPTKTSLIPPENLAELSKDSPRASSSSLPVPEPLFGIRISPRVTDSSSSVSPRVDAWCLTDGAPDFRPPSHQTDQVRRKRPAHDELAALLEQSAKKARDFETLLKTSLD